MPKSDKRNKILVSARELIVEHGFHGASMAMIASKAKVGAGTIYIYFKSKDVLVLELFCAARERLYRAVTDGYPAGDKVRDRFLHLGKAIMHFFIASPMDFLFLEQFRDSPYGMAHRSDNLLGKQDTCIIKRTLTEGLERQEVKDLPLPAIYALAFGPLRDICRSHILGFTKLDDQLIAQSVEACWEATKR